MYTLSRAAHIRQNDHDTTRSPSKRRQHRSLSTYIDLIDERSERSNGHVLDLSFEDIDGGHSSASSGDEDSFDEKMILDTKIDNLSNSTATNDPTSHSQSVSETITTTTTGRCSATVSISSFNRTSYRDININNNNSISLRSSPRNREKWQPKITGKQNRARDTINTHFHPAICLCTVVFRFSPNRLPASVKITNTSNDMSSTPFSFGPKTLKTRETVSHSRRCMGKITFIPTFVSIV